MWVEWIQFRCERYPFLSFFFSLKKGWFIQVQLWNWIWPDIFCGWRFQYQFKFQSRYFKPAFQCDFLIIDSMAGCIVLFYLLTNSCIRNHSECVEKYYWIPTRPRKKNVVLPSATDPSQKIKFKKMGSGMHSVFVRFCFFTFFETNGQLELHGWRHHYMGSIGVFRFPLYICGMYSSWESLWGSRKLKGGNCPSRHFAVAHEGKLLCLWMSQFLHCMLLPA